MGNNIENIFIVITLIIITSFIIYSIWLFFWPIIINRRLKEIITILTEIKTFLKKENK